MERLINVEHKDATTVITMNRPQKRNALSMDHIGQLTEAFHDVSQSQATGIILAANGPVFSSGHDFSEMNGKDIVFMHDLLSRCAELMLLIGSVPQVVIASVQGLATAAGAQLVASCDLAVASDQAGFAAPGGKGGWFCYTPMVALSRAIGRKQAFEMAFTGDTIDAHTALSWGLVNRVVPAGELESATEKLLARATRGSATSKAAGKRILGRQLDLEIQDAYALAIEAMAGASQTPDAREGMDAFVTKRTPKFGQTP